MPKIREIKALKILDSRGQWTLKTTVLLGDGAVGEASVPSGASVGKYEAKTKDPEEVVRDINGEVGKKLLGKEVGNQKNLDQFLIDLDGTKSKARLGANLTLVLSQAFCDAAAKSLKIPLYRYIDSLFEPKVENFSLPTPIFNMLNGGEHAKNNLDFQEFLLVPISNVNFRTKLDWGVKVYHTLENLLSLKKYSTELGDEGGFAPQEIKNDEAFSLLKEAVRSLSLTLTKDVFLGCDVAAGTFFKDSRYNLKGLGRFLGSRELRDLYRRMISKNHLIFLEDPFAEDVWEDWMRLTAKFGERIEIVGDDLIATNLERLLEAVEKNAITGVIIKPNQVGTISETLAVVEEAKKAGLTVVVSHRSGETGSSFIADFAVGIGAKYLKAGAPARGERVAKYDRLLEIEEEIR